MKGLVVFSYSTLDDCYGLGNVTCNFNSSEPSMKELNYVVNQIKRQGKYESVVVINVIPLSDVKED